MKNLVAYENLISKEVEQLCKIGRFAENKHFMQHGSITVYEHCISVAYMSCYLAEKLHLTVNLSSLVRGALLHDYFLYDWHNKAGNHHLHGFTHPKRSLENASADFQLTPVEINIILRHMFPLTPIPPTCTESWVVCLADKICATRETLQRKR